MIDGSNGYKQTFLNSVQMHLQERDRAGQPQTGIPNGHSRRNSADRHEASDPKIVHNVKMSKHWTDGNCRY